MQSSCSQCEGVVGGIGEGWSTCVSSDDNLRNFPDVTNLQDKVYGLLIVVGELVYTCSISIMSLDSSADIPVVICIVVIS